MTSSSPETMVTRSKISGTLGGKRVEAEVGKFACKECHQIVTGTKVSRAAAKGNTKGCFFMISAGLGLKI